MPPKASKISTRRKGFVPDVKIKKDKAAPKHARSAYTFYLEEAHGKIKEAEPEASFGEVSKRISSEWKKMDDESKAVYVAMSDDDKARYAIEKEAYVPTIGFGSDGKAIVVGKAFKAKRAKKDKNLPKGVLSAYIIFCTQMRSVIKTENPGIANTDIMKQTGERWRAMDAKDKEPWDALSAQDKKRHDEEMDHYRSNL